MAAVGALSHKDVVIDSLEMLLRQLASEHGIKAGGPELRDILKEDLGMSYRKVVAISMQANSDKNLVCRQQFALAMLGALDQGKVVLNVDET